MLIRVFIPPSPLSPLLPPSITSSDSTLSHVSLAAGHEACHLDLVEWCTHLVGNLSRIIYIIKQDIHIYMLSIDGQTARPNGLKFLWTLMGGRGVFKNIFFHEQRRVLKLVISA